MSAEPIDKSSNAAGPQLCTAGCGFFGSERTEGYCSKCYRDEMKKRGQPTPQPSPSITPASPAFSSSSTNPSPQNPLQVTFTNTVSSKPIAIPPASNITPSLSSPALGGLSAAVATSSSLSPSNLSPSPLSTSPLSSSPSTGRKRCNVCKKKLTLDYFTCKCSEDNLFCAQHRLPHAHGCTYQHRKDQQSKIEKQNPVVKHEKLESI